MEGGVAPFFPSRILWMEMGKIMIEINVRGALFFWRGWWFREPPNSPFYLQGEINVVDPRPT
jgi:hypothetical protein